MGRKHPDELVRLAAGLSSFEDVLCIAGMELPTTTKDCALLVEVPNSRVSTRREASGVRFANDPLVAVGCLCSNQWPNVSRSTFDVIDRVTAAPIR